MFAVKISGHLKKLSEKNDAVRKQFYPSELELRFLQKENSFNSSSFCDPLFEDQYEKTKGLVHKYKNRVLILLTLTCAAYCRFCTRRRKVSDIKKGIIFQADIKKMLAYLFKNPEINEVIFSGGDPLASPAILKYALNKFSRLPQIKIIRIGTRAPVSNPKLITKDLLAIIKKIKQPVYVGIHFEHPAELTKETILACQKLRKAGAILYSQSVFLKGVNDSYEILYELFTKLIQVGIRPYYLYRCDPVQGIGHFRVAFKKEVEIATKLRKNLSGLAWPTYAIDAVEGSGKIPVPLDFWEFNKERFKDFLGNKKKVI
ncbi:MAG: KamA family radical SAM protein [bacterium]|nr:KamA family radical SAM protein [bacterium]